MDESPIERALAGKPMGETPNPAAEATAAQTHRVSTLATAAIVLFLIASALNIWAIQTVASNAQTITYNKKVEQCILEQIEEHRVNSQVTHQDIAAGEQPPVSVPSKTFGGQFRVLSPQDLQRIKDKLAAACAAVDPTITAPN